MTHKVCPYCKQTSYVCVESYPEYRVESFYVSGKTKPICEIDEDYCEYAKAGKPRLIYCPQCESEYTGCSSVEEAWERMILREK